MTITKRATAYSWLFFFLSKEGFIHISVLFCGRMEGESSNLSRSSAGSYSSGGETGDVSGGGRAVNILWGSDDSAAKERFFGCKYLKWRL
jgi:hypothetical protein